MSCHEEFVDQSPTPPKKEITTHDINQPPNPQPNPLQSQKPSSRSHTLKQITIYPPSPSQPSTAIHPSPPNERKAVNSKNEELDILVTR